MGYNGGGGIHSCTMELANWKLSLAVPLLLVAAAIHFLSHVRKKPAATLPPGPRPWPLVGNLVDIVLLLRYGGRDDNDPKKKMPQPMHAALATLSRSHGPLLYLRLGTQPFVVASSAAAASEVLKTNDRAVSGRSVPACYRSPIYSDHSIFWSPVCDEQWKSLRSICRAELFSNRSLANWEAVRESKAAELVGLLSREEGKGVKVADVVFATVFDMFGRIMFSRDVMRGGAAEGGQLKRDIQRSIALPQVPNVEDFFPALFGGWDPQGLRKEAMVYVLRVFDLWDGLIQERKGELERGEQGKEDFLNVLLNSGFDGFPLKAFIMEVFSAGTDTTTTWMEWTMAELIKNPDKMKRLKDELETAVGKPSTGGNPQLRESDVLHLPYLQACIKESLRLHPSAPLLVPRRAVEPFEVMGYTIPKGSVVLINAWAIGRDPESWEDPLAFTPERFLGSGACRDYKGADFEFVPFGSGRRICPGLGLATRVMSLVLGTMVHHFDWELPGGMEPSGLSMEEKPGLVLDRKEPLVLVAVPKVQMSMDR